jgi:hypothetical protein
MSITGLTVELPTPCRTCRRSFIATIGMGNDQHPASVRCKACNVHRGWMSHETHNFIVEIIKNFGILTSPIAMRLGEEAASAAESERPRIRS